MQFASLVFCSQGLCVLQKQYAQLWEKVKKVSNVAFRQPFLASSEIILVNSEGGMSPPLFMQKDAPLSQEVINRKSSRSFGWMTCAFQPWLILFRSPFQSLPDPGFDVCLSLSLCFCHSLQLYSILELTFIIVQLFYFVGCIGPDGLVKQVRNRI